MAFKFYLYWILLCIFTETGEKENASSFPRQDVANLKNFSLGMGFLALQLFVSISKGTKRPIFV